MEGVSTSFGNEKPVSIPISEVSVRAASVHESISINGNDALDAFVNKTGSGTRNEPYIIENLEINTTWIVDAIRIINTDKYLTIRGCNLIGNISDSSMDGIFLENVSNVRIVENNISSFGEIGLNLRNSTNIVAESNTVMMTRIGAYIGGSGSSSYSVHLINNYISTNISGYNPTGIFIYSAEDTLVYNNTVREWSYSGITISGNSNRSLIYYNMFDNVGAVSGEQATSEGGQAWDNGAIGNYWSDYTTRYPGAENDGYFWNITYIIDGDQDRFPLVTPWRLPPITDPYPDQTTTVLFLAVTTAIVIVVVVRVRRKR